jgi:hypothetical protein
MITKPKGLPKTGGAVKGRSSRAAKVLEQIKERGGKQPLELLLDVMNNEEMPIDFRIDAAKAAAPYVHRKMPTEIEQTNMNAYEKLSEDELLQRLKELG